METTHGETAQAPLLQRLRLYEALLSDVYGPQRLLQSGWVDAALLWAHPGYVRALRGVAPATPRLHALRWNFGGGGLTTCLQGLPEVAMNDLQAAVVLQAHTDDEAASRLAALCKLPCVPNHALQAEGDALWWLQAPGGPTVVTRLLRTCCDADLDPMDLADRTGNPAAGVPGLAALWCAQRVQVLNAPGAGWLEAPWVEAEHGRLCEWLLGEPGLALPSESAGTVIAWRSTQGPVQWQVTP